MVTIEEIKDGKIVASVNGIHLVGGNSYARLRLAVGGPTEHDGVAYSMVRVDGTGVRIPFVPEGHADMVSIPGWLFSPRDIRALQSIGLPQRS